MEIPVLGLDVPTWAVLVVTALALLYKYTTKNFGFFKERGIPGPTPYPFVGTMYLAMKHGLGKADRMVIDKYGKVAGLFMGSSPSFLIADEDMLKQILVKEFNHFTNRKKVGVAERPFDKMITVLDDDDWRHVRSSITPAFSGVKLRKMKRDINECAKCLVSNLSKIADDGESFECKQYIGSFSSDCIARVAFGIDLDSQNDPKHPFVRHMRKVLDIDFTNVFLIVAMFFPVFLPIVKKMGFSFMGEKATKYFEDLLDAAKKEKSSATTKRTDFLQMMMDLQKERAVGSNGENKWLTSDEILSQCIIFFFAAYGTVGDTVSTVLHLLSVHPEVQEKLFEEVMSVMGDQDEIDYDAAKKLEYMEMVFNESLRLHPSASTVDRVCSADVNINGLHIPKGAVVNIPIQAIQMDPELWPEPEKFDPERFSPQKKADMNPYHWLPFGAGPRNCVGMRLALLEIKVCLAHIIKNFHVEPSEKTPVPLTWKKMTGAPVGLYLKVRR